MFYSFANRGKKKWQCLNEQQWFGFAAACIKRLIAAVLLLCLECVRTDIMGSMLYKVYTCCCSKSTPNWKAGIILELDYKGNGLSVTLMETKSNITCSPWERDGLAASDKTSR